LEIKWSIIQGTNSLHLRGKAIEQNHDLENLLKSVCAMKTDEEQTSEIEKQNSSGLIRIMETSVNVMVDFGD